MEEHALVFVHQGADGRLELHAAVKVADAPVLDVEPQEELAVALPVRIGRW